MNASNWQSVICDNPHILSRTLQELPNITTRNQLEVAFLKLQRTNLEIIQNLIEILIEVKNTQFGTRIVSTTGTTIGAIGAVAMVAGACIAPVTGGMSMLFSVGLVASVTSGATALGTTMYSRYANKKFVENISALQQQQNQISAELNCQLGIIDTIVMELQRSGIEKNMAIGAAFAVVHERVHESILGPDGQISVEKLQKLIRKVLSVIRECQAAGAGFAAICTALGTRTKPLMDAARYVATLSGTVTEAGSKGVENGGKVLTTLGNGLSNSKVILKRVGAVTGVVFTAVDIVLLVKEWKTPDPLIQHIESVVTILIDDVGKCESMLYIIRGEASASDMPPVYV